MRLHSEPTALMSHASTLSLLMSNMQWLEAKTRSWLCGIWTLQVQQWLWSIIVLWVFVRLVVMDSVLYVELFAARLVHSINQTMTTKITWERIAMLFWRWTIMRQDVTSSQSQKTKLSDFGICRPLISLLSSLVQLIFQHVSQLTPFCLSSQPASNAASLESLKWKD